MEEMLRAQLEQWPTLVDILLRTGDWILYEPSNKFWGYSNGIGENNFGELLMKLRGEYRGIGLEIFEKEEKWLRHIHDKYVITR